MKNIRLPFARDHGVTNPKFYGVFAAGTIPSFGLIKREQHFCRIHMRVFS